MKTNKSELRCKNKALRDELFECGKLDKISASIVLQIENLEVFKVSKNIMLFYPKKGEVDLTGLFKNSDKSFFLPKCISKDIVACPYALGDELVESDFKVKEPLSEAVKNVEILDLILTPALAADKMGNRIGYGCGFYDRFFENENLRAQKIIVLPEELLVEEIVADEFDVKCDLVLTQNGGVN